MENRKKLHDAGLALIILAVADLFSYFMVLMTNYIDGSFESQLPESARPYLTASLVVLFAIGVILTGAQVLIGYKGLQISKNPTNGKGHITAAKIFFALCVISTVTTVVALFKSTGASTIQNAFSTANVVLDVCIYAYYIKAAEAVRNSAE